MFKNFKKMFRKVPKNLVNNMCCVICLVVLVLVIVLLVRQGKQCPPCERFQGQGAPPNCGSKNNEEAFIYTMLMNLIYKENQQPNIPYTNIPYTNSGAALRKDVDNAINGNVEMLKQIYRGQLIGGNREKFLSLIQDVGTDYFSNRCLSRNLNLDPVFNETKLEEITNYLIIKIDQSMNGMIGMNDQPQNCDIKGQDEINIYTFIMQIPPLITPDPNDPVSTAPSLMERVQMALCYEEQAPNNEFSIISVYNNDTSQFKEKFKEKFIKVNRSQLNCGGGPSFTDEEVEVILDAIKNHDPNSCNQKLAEYREPDDGGAGPDPYTEERINRKLNIIRMGPTEKFLQRNNVTNNCNFVEIDGSRMSVYDFLLNLHEDLATTYDNYDNMETYLRRKALGEENAKVLRNRLEEVFELSNGGAGLYMNYDQFKCSRANELLEVQSIKRIIDRAIYDLNNVNFRVIQSHQWLNARLRGPLSSFADPRNRSPDGNLARDKNFILRNKRLPCDDVESLIMHIISSSRKNREIHELLLDKEMAPSEWVARQPPFLCPPQ